MKMTTVAAMMGACVPLLAIPRAALANTTGLIAAWSFDEGQGTVTAEAVADRQDALLGHLFFGPGVRGSGLRFDGFTSRVVCPAAEAPRLTQAFTLEAWVAPQEYSWNWTGLVDQEKVSQNWTGDATVLNEPGLAPAEKETKTGYSFGINHLGQIGLYAAVDGKWQGCLSQEAAPLLTWSHVAGVFDPALGFKVYINGKLAAQNGVKGKLNSASDTELWLGMSHRKQYPAGTERQPSKRFLSAMVFDGLLDEVRCFERALTAAEIEQSFRSVKVAVTQPLQYRRMPTGPEGPGRFGAYYTKLKYCPEWDRLWPAADQADIVVRFDESPTKLVFWRGTGYIPYWAAENGVCVADEGVESANAWGCCEAMSDKQCRYSQVRIIENTPARAVVHWRTASPDIRYGSANVNPDTGWGDWTDDYFYIYPDGVSVRYQLVHSTAAAGMEFQQTQALNQPGTRPEDNLEAEAITILNMNGDAGRYVWDRPYGRAVKKLADANIQVTNLKAGNRHYVIGETGSHWEPFSFGAPPWTYFPCWNHWPVAQLPNDGRVAAAPDRPSSSCCGTLYPVKHRLDNATMFARDLYGMTDQPLTTLVTLARSWNFPAELALAGDAYASEGYDQNQRAYLLTSKPGNTPAALDLTLAGSPRSPALNPAFVVQNWGDAEVKLTLNGKAIPRGKNFRCGHRQTLEGTDLIVWLKVESETALKVRLEREGRPSER